MSNDSNKKHKWPAPPEPVPRPVIQPALFHACEWYLLRKPEEGVLVRIDLTTHNRPRAAPAATQPGELQQTPAYVLVKRERRQSGEYIRTYGKIVDVNYNNFDEASRDAGDRNRTDISNEDHMPEQSKYRKAYDLEQISEIQAYAQAGLLQVIHGRERIVWQVLRDWQDQNGPHAPENHLIVAHGEMMAARLNLACQLCRRANCESTAFGRIELCKANFHPLYKGDCVLISDAYHDAAVRNHRGIILPSSKREDLVVGMSNGTVTHIRGHEVFDHVDLGYAITADRARNHLAEYSYVVVENIDRRSSGTSYKHSHDPTCTNIYVEHGHIKAGLRRIAKWGYLHGDLVRMHWKNKYAMNLQANREADQVDLEHSMNPNISQER